MKLNRAVFATVATLAATITVATGSARRAFAQGSDTATPPTPSETQMGNVPEPTPPEATPPVAEPAPVAPAPMVVPPYPDRGSDVLLPQPYARWRPRSGMGLALMVGGGVTDFTGGTTRNETSTGGAWTARMAIATRSIIGFDASYVGGANTLTGLGGGNTTLVRNGLEGAVRINAPLYSFDTLFEPYAIVGVGWNAYRLANVTSNGVDPDGPRLRARLSRVHGRRPLHLPPDLRPVDLRQPDEQRAHQLGPGRHGRLRVLSLAPSG
jgi:hypothetical protein